MHRSLVRHVRCVHLQPHAAATAEALRGALSKLAAATAATLNSDFGKPQRHLEVTPFAVGQACRRSHAASLYHHCHLQIAKCHSDHGCSWRFVRRLSTKGSSTMHVCIPAGAEGADQQLGGGGPAAGAGRRRGVALGRCICWPAGLGARSHRVAAAGAQGVDTEPTSGHAPVPCPDAPASQQTHAVRVWADTAATVVRRMGLPRWMVAHELP